uniref:Xrn1 N-terminal domain-containing protein n=1 Tax=viral metagenome TaxID=1070528 RepID=A0A6C0E1K3_9ZZZZ
MGIFNFYTWFRNNFSKDIYKVHKNISEINDDNFKIDNLMIDCNGLFHMSAQKVFKYGNFKPTYKVEIKENRLTQQQVYEDVCYSIENILLTVNPTKRIILCVDGPAPISKQAQQRKRRFKAAVDREEGDKSFDSNKLSPGTEFMDHLCKYIEWFIRKRLTENPIWQNIEVVYSPCNVPSEGEQKLMNYLRKYGKKNESYIIHGLDADLIMLSLLSHFPKFYVLRDDTYDRNNNFLLIDIGSVRKQLIEMMRWEPENEDYKFIEEWIINDFVFLCFILGNDFLPHIPSLEIVEGGIEVILNVCKTVGRTHGHMTRNTKGNIVFCVVALQKFFEIISESEKQLFEQKYKHRSRYFPDDLLTKHATFDGERYIIDRDNYIEDYNIKYFGDEDIEKVCHSYLVGLQWILTYYTKEVPSWKWYYPYHYAPSSSTIINYMSTYSKPRYHKGLPSPPIMQLISILPPQSSDLLPKSMHNVLKTNLKKFCPDKIEVDLSGKKQEYQGIVLLPFTEYKVIQKVYEEYVDKLDKNELKRNIIGKTVVYSYNPAMTRLFYSYYGNIPDCAVEFKIIDI